MATSQEYRDRARECMEIAQRTRTTDRPLLLEMAQAWLTLADETDPALRRAVPPTIE